MLFLKLGTITYTHSANIFYFGKVGIYLISLK